MGRCSDTGLLWIALFAGPYLTLATQGALTDLELPPIALSLPTLAIELWAREVGRSPARLAR